MIKINGKDTAVDGLSLQALIEKKGYRKDRIAIELNGQIVPRAAYESTLLKTGDSMEIVQFVGGG